MTWERSGSGHRRSRRRPEFTVRLGAEVLEPRRLPAALTVNTTADDATSDGTLSLREAIEVSNGTLAVSALSPQEQAQVSGALSSPNTIAFNVPGAGVRTINLTAALPAVTSPVVIDGYSQPGSSKNTLTNADDAKLLIELNASGLAAGKVPMVIRAGDSVVQGLVIDSANSAAALELSEAGATGDVVRGNFLGVNPAGTRGSGLSAGGIVLTFGASKDTIGGATPDARNVISGSAALTGGLIGRAAVEIDILSDSVIVEGNFIGVDVTGNGATGSRSGGVEIGQGSSDNVIGGTAPGAGNVISGNGGGSSWPGFGIATAGLNTRIEGNRIGTNAAGSAPLGNLGDGIQVRAGARHTVIGGTAAGATNVIAFNRNDGVFVQTTDPTAEAVAAVDSAVLENAILGNQKLGIELQPGANGGTPAPVLSSPVPTAAGGFAVGVTVTGQPNTTYRVEVFGNPAVDHSGGGQGQVFLGTTSVTTGPDGTAPAATFRGAAVPGFNVLSATETDPDNGTSEFSRDATLNTSPPAQVGTTLTVTANPAAASPGQPVTLTIVVAPKTGSGIPTGTVTISDAGQALGTVTLDGAGRAVLPRTFASGVHQISASYSGDSRFLPSNGSTSVTVSIAGGGGGGTGGGGQGGDGPVVVGLQRYGYHAMPTTVVLGFNEALDPARAQDVRNYTIVGPGGQVIGVDSAAYDPAAKAVVLHPRSRLNLHWGYQLVVNGTRPGGVADTAGRLLDGVRNGRPGSDFVAKLDAGALVVTGRGPGAAAALRLANGFRSGKHAVR